MENETYTIKQTSERLGVSVWKVRRLCRNGMVPRIRRNRAGYQMLSSEQVSYIGMLLVLERAGMSRGSLKRLASLYRDGKKTLVQRKAMLETQRRQFWQKLEDLQQGIDVIERQIELIDAELKP